VEDGSGGMLIAWKLGGDALRGQRVDGLGAKLWDPQGVSLTSLPGTNEYVRISPDLAGGLFAAWENWPSGSWNLRDAYAQHLSAQGVLTWQPPTGILLRGGSNKHVDGAVPAGAADGSSLFFWSERRDRREWYLSAEINAAGQMLFGPLGQSVHEAIAEDAEELSLLTLGNNHFLSCWVDYRSFPINGQINPRVFYQVMDTAANLPPRDGWRSYLRGI